MQERLLNNAQSLDYNPNRQMANSEWQSGILFLYHGDHLKGAEDTAEPSMSYGSFNFK